MNPEKISAILEKYEAEQSASDTSLQDISTISILQDIQEEFGYLPKEAIRQVSRELNLPLSRVLSLATFFNAFSLKPRGKHAIHVCMGTACHVRGAQLVLEKLERELKIKKGDTTEDREFSLDEVRCVGCCGLAPVVMVGEDVHGKISQAKIPGVLKKYTK